MAIILPSVAATYEKNNHQYETKRTLKIEIYRFYGSYTSWVFHLENPIPI